MLLIGLQVRRGGGQDSEKTESEDDFISVYIK